jgi:hypothetical protein
MYLIRVVKEHLMNKVLQALAGVVKFSGILFFGPSDQGLNLHSHY